MNTNHRPEPTNKFEPYRAKVDLTPGASGVVKDQWGWFLAYVVRQDGTINWLGVTTNQKQAEAWGEEEMETQPQ